MTGFVVRTATPDDIEALVDFEVQIALVSFGHEAIEDRRVHRNRLEKGIDRDPLSAFVAVENSTRLGWLWLTENTNFLTGRRYCTMRSFAVSPVMDRDAIAEALFGRAENFAAERGVTEIVGKVHPENVGMRLLYARHGFSPFSLSMRRRVGLRDDAL